MRVPRSHARTRASSLFVVASGFFLSSQAEATPLFTVTAQSNTVSMTQSYTAFHPCPCPPGGVQTVTPFAASVSSTQVGNFNQAFQNTFTVPPVNGPNGSLTLSASSSQLFRMNDSSISVLFGTSVSGEFNANNAFPENVLALSSFDIQFTVAQSTQLAVHLSLLGAGPIIPSPVIASLPGIGEIGSGGFGLPPGQHPQDANLQVTLNPGTYNFNGLSGVTFSPESTLNFLGGTGDITLSFSPAIPEPSAALVFAVGALVVGRACRVKA